MPLPAFAAMLGRVLPAMVGEGELLSGLLTRSGASGAEAAGVKGLSGMLSDLLMNGLTGGSKPPRRQEGEGDREERAKRDRHVPSAADLFGYYKEAPALPKSMPIPLARSSTPTPAQSAAAAGPVAQAAVPPGGSTFVPPNATPNNPAQRQSIGMLQQFTSKLFQSLGPLGKQIGFWTKINTGLYTGAKALETFVWGISESNRGLARWNGEIATSFAQLDIANMRRDVSTATATSSSTVALNDSFNALLEEMQPIRNSVATGLNVLGIIAANVARGVSILTKINPGVWALMTVLESIEALMKKDEPMKDPLADFLKDLRTGMGGLRGPAAPPVPIGPRDPLPPII